MVHAAESVTSSAPAPNPWPAGSVRKIPIGVFDPVYEHLALDAMLDKVTALGLEAMEIGTGGYPNNIHCPLDDLIADQIGRASCRERGSPAPVPAGRHDGKPDERGGVDPATDAAHVA